MRIVLYIVIVSDDEDASDTSAGPLRDCTVLSNHSKMLESSNSLESNMDTMLQFGSVSDISPPDQIPYEQLLNQSLTELNNDSNNQESPQNFLQSLRVKNVDRILIGHLNVNSIPNKIELVSDLIQDRIDIFLISETKIDKSFPNAQFEINGFSPPPS